MPAQAHGRVDRRLRRPVSLFADFFVLNTPLPLFRGCLKRTLPMLCALALPFGAPASVPTPASLGGAAIEPIEPLSGAHPNVLALWQTRENSISDPLNDPGAKFAERPRTHLPGSAHTVQLLSSKLPPNTVHADSVDTTCHSIAVEQGVTDEWCTDHCSPHDCALSVCSRGCQDRSGGMTRGEVASSLDDMTLPQHIAAQLPSLFTVPGKQLPT